MKKKYYLIGSELFFGTAKKAFQKSHQLGGVGVLKISNKRKLKELKQLTA